MIKHYLKIAFRSMTKDKGYVFVNLIGLSVAIMCCFLLMFWVKFEYSYERSYPDHNRIYRVVCVENRDDGEKVKNPFMRPHLVYEMKEMFPQIEAATFMRGEAMPFTRDDAPEDADGVSLLHVQSNADFLRVFSFEYLEGSPQAVNSSNGSVITREAAEKLFGKESPIGKTIKAYSSVQCKIAAVVEVPKNTNIRFDVLNIGAEGYYQGENYGGTQYLFLQKGVNARQFSAQLSNLLSTVDYQRAFSMGSENAKYQIELQPIKDMHLNSDWVDSNNRTMIRVFSLVAGLILLIALINYINTSIARAIGRMKEVGVRKVVGSSKTQLVVRFLSDSFVVSFLATFIAIALVKEVFPAFSELMGYKLDLVFDSSTILIAILVCLVITVLSGGYAAFYLSSFSPMLILKGGSSTGSKERLRKTLIGVQFFLSAGVLICTTIFYKQINYMYKADTGVVRENIVALRTGLWYDAEDFITVIKNENPNVIDATIAMGAPFDCGWGFSGISWEGSDADKSIDYAEIACDNHYADVFGLEVIQGEFIKPGLSRGPNNKPDDFDMVINETMRDIMGEENPIGITVSYGWGRKGKIVGVVKDFNFKPLREKIAPLIITHNPEMLSTVLVKTTGRDKQATLDYLLAKYNEMKPSWTRRAATYSYAVDDYNNMYKAEQTIAKLFFMFSIISFVLSIMGVVSMVSFLAEKRTKEIAIRKINGAKIINIIALFVIDILKVTLIASAFALPIAYLVMDKWQQSYVFKTALSWWIFILIPLVIFIVISVIIAAQIYNTARRNPVLSLKND